MVLGFADRCVVPLFLILVLVNWICMLFFYSFPAQSYALIFFWCLARVWFSNVCPKIPFCHPCCQWGKHDLWNEPLKDAKRISCDKKAATPDQKTHTPIVYVCVCVCPCENECEWAPLGQRVDTAIVTGLHMLICCTCGAGITGLCRVRMTPYPLPCCPPFIPAECGSPFMLISQRRGGEEERLEKEEKQWSQRWRCCLSLLIHPPPPPLAHGKGRTIGVQMLVFLCPGRLPSSFTPIYLPPSLPLS